MSFAWQKNMTIIFTITIALLLVKLSVHSLTISLVGSVAAIIICLLLIVFQKFRIPFFNLLTFHFLTVALFLSLPVAEVFIFALLITLLRENILLAKQKTEKDSRFSLLSDLGIIKPQRQVSPNLNISLILTITSLISWSAASLFPIIGTPLAYFMLFLFAMAIGSLIVKELASAKTG